MAFKSSSCLDISSYRPYFTGRIMISVLLLCLSSIQSLPTTSSLSSPSHQATAAGRMEYPRILIPSLAIAMVTGISNGSASEYCLVHFNSDDIPTHIEESSFIPIHYMSTKFCRFHAEANSNSSLMDEYLNEYLLIDYDPDCPLNESITTVKQSYPMIKGNFHFILIISSNLHSSFHAYHSSIIIFRTERILSLEGL